MGAESIARDELLNYCEGKSKGWDPLSSWKLYHYLLEKAQAYREDTSGYESPEYQKDFHTFKARLKEEHPDQF